MLPRHVRQLRDELKDSPGAANQRLKALKALFAWACEDEPELAPQNPTLGVKKIKYATKGHHSWNTDEVEELRLVPRRSQRPVQQRMRSPQLPVTGALRKSNAIPATQSASCSLIAR
jgi:hypothetical protein